MRADKTPQQIKEYNSLDDAEKKIYDSIISTFSATSYDSAFNKALEGGLNCQFIQK